MPFNIGPKHHNILPRPLIRLIEDFFDLQDWKGVYLTGGSCLAEFYFGHRISIDMDLFAESKDVFSEAGRSLEDAKSFRTGSISSVRKTPHLAQYLYQSPEMKEPIKIDLMLEITPRISEPIKFGHIWIDSLDDLLANKLGCIVQRSDIKDYLDLFQLIPASHLTARELIELGGKKEGGLDPLIMAQQLEFLFKEPCPEPNLLGHVNWTEVQLFFKKLQKELFELIRPEIF